MTLKTLGMGIANVVTKKIKDKAMKEAQKQFKKTMSSIKVFEKKLDKIAKERKIRIEKQKKELGNK